MVCVVGVRFKMAGKVYYFDPAELPITSGNKVIVETVRGVEYGEVVVGPKDVEDDQVVQPLKKVIRVGTDRDVQIATENKRKEKEAFSVALKKIEAHNLDMYLVDVEYTFDGSKIIFYFTAEGRVDFRELVRDLAGVFRTRIEMRQIGVRDEAKLLGGIGPCGRILCCTSFLGDFAPVSIRMAKDQNLSLNPSKISGLCGRLMCCLRYEQDTYEAAKKDPTLAPGYVPPVLLEADMPNFAELEDERPTPAIGVRNRSESGFSARIAQAAAVIDKPDTRRERPARPERSERTDRPERPERPQGGFAAPERLPGEKLSGSRFSGGGEGRPQGDRPQGRPQDSQGRREGRPQGDRPQGRPQDSQGRRDGRPQGDRPQGRPTEQPGGRREGRPQGERPQGRPTEQPGGRREGRPQGERPQGDRPAGRPQDSQRPQQRPQGERTQNPPVAQAVGEERQGSGNRRRKRRRGAGGPRPEGGGPNPAE